MTFRLVLTAVMVAAWTLNVAAAEEPAPASASVPTSISPIAAAAPGAAAVPATAATPNAAAAPTAVAAPAATESSNSEPTTETTPAEPLLAPPAPDLPAVELPPTWRPTTPIDLTAQHEDLWDRVRNNFSMPNLDNALVARHEAWYARQPEYLRRVIERSRPYLHHIVEELEKRGMPSELALLPIVESSYNPLAISTSRASGLWQFIPSTGRNYKLDQTWWVDERRDIMASTGAALEYLQYIYEMHGDWHLALASYNWGEGAVGRAIAKNRAKKLPTDYASLKMPKETQNYVPKLQALKNILSNRQLWDSLNIPSIPNKPYFSMVIKPADMDVKVAARLAEMPIAEFRALNPAHNRPVIKADLPIILPAEKVDTFMTNFAQNDDPLVSWHTYTFQKTDKVEKLAARVGMTVEQFKAVNGVSGKKARVVPGQTLLLPSPELIAMKEPLDTFAPPAAPEKKWKRGRKGGKKAAAGHKASKSSHSSTSNKPKSVRKGDTVDSAARRRNVPTSSITKRDR